MDKTKLQNIALEIRKGALTAVFFSQKGHPGGALGRAGILAYLYF